MLMHGPRRGADGEKQDRDVRCWSCDEPVFPHAVRCRYCGAELAPQAYRTREDRGVLYNPERRRGRRDYRSDGRGPTRADGPTLDGASRRNREPPEAAAPWNEADFERISRDAGAGADEQDPAGSAEAGRGGPDWGDSDFERISQTAGPTGSSTVRGRAAARRAAPDPAPSRQEFRESRRAGGRGFTERPADDPSDRQAQQRSTRGAAPTDGTARSRTERRPDGGTEHAGSDPGRIRPLRNDPAENPRQPETPEVELPPEPETVAEMEIPPLGPDDAREQAHLFGAPVDDDPIELGPIEDIHWQEAVVDDTPPQEPVYDARPAEEPEPEPLRAEPEPLRAEPMFERPRGGRRFDGPVLEARIEDRPRQEDRVHIRPAVGVGPAHGAEMPRSRARFLGGVAVGALLTAVVVTGWAAGWWDRSGEVVDWLTTTESADVAAGPGANGENSTAASPDASGGAINVPVRPGDRLASLKEKYGSDDVGGAGSISGAEGATSSAGPDETAAAWRQWTVRDVQRALAGLGYYDGEVDGLVGPLTRGAVRAFQQEVGLEPTGHIQPTVVEALARAESRTTR